MTAGIELGPPGLTLNPGDHICAFYRGPAGRDEVLVPFLRAGIDAGHKCIAVLDQMDPADVWAELEDAGPQAAEHVDLHASGDTYLKGGSFSTDAMIEFWRSEVAASVDDGEYEFARTLGEMTWALQQLPGVEALVDYESELNRHIRPYDQVTVCLYDLDQFDGRVVVDLLRSHPKLLLCGSLLDNPYYLEPDDFVAHRRGSSAP